MWPECLIAAVELFHMPVSMAADEPTTGAGGWGGC